MVKIEFLGPIEKEPIEVEISSLEELAEIFSRDEEMKKWIGKCAVAVNDRLTDNIRTALKPGDTISILPPVCGG